MKLNEFVSVNYFIRKCILFSKVSALISAINTIMNETKSFPFLSLDFEKSCSAECAASNLILNCSLKLSFCGLRILGQTPYLVLLKVLQHIAATSKYHWLLMYLKIKQYLYTYAAFGKITIQGLIK